MGSLVVNPGDLIHADEHGVTIIPREIRLDELLEAVRRFLASERTLVDYFQQPQFELDAYLHLVHEHEKEMDEDWRLKNPVPGS